MSQNKENVNQALSFPLGEQFENDVTAVFEQEDGQSAIIALIDLDNFGRINDEFGPAVGDDVLISTGRYWADQLPEGAAIYRVAGDQFGILFRGEIEKEDVFLFMEEHRRQMDLRDPNGTPITVSVGIAEAFEDASRYQELYRKADSAMYRAKYNGHNKVALAKEEKMVPKTSHYTSDQLKRLTRLSKKEGIGEAILLREALDMLLKKYEN